MSCFRTLAQVSAPALVGMNPKPQGNQLDARRTELAACRSTRAAGTQTGSQPTSRPPSRGETSLGAS